MKKKNKPIKRQYTILTNQVLFENGNVVYDYHLYQVETEQLFCEFKETFQTEIAKGESIAGVWRGHLFVWAYGKLNQEDAKRLNNAKKSLEQQKKIQGVKI